MEPKKQIIDELIKRKKDKEKTIEQQPSSEVMHKDHRQKFVDNLEGNSDDAARLEKALQWACLDLSSPDNLELILWNHDAAPNCPHLEGHKKNFK